MDKRLILTEGANPNYLATICKIGKLYPIENADRLLKTVVNGYDIVVSKDFHEGDIVVYFPVESCISQKFLSANNQYGQSDFELNQNAEEVKAILLGLESMDDEGKKAAGDKVKALCGFFNANGRVRMLKLRGQYSMGFISGIDSLVKYDSSLADVNWEENVGVQFNTVGDDMLVKKYVPKIKPKVENDGSRKNYFWKKSMSKLRRFNCMIDGQFEFHYETEHLQEHMDRISPEDNVSISLKVHGSSFIISNILCLKNLPWWKKVLKRLGANIKDKEFKKIYSSRRVIQNEDVNPNKDSYYSENIYNCVFRDFGEFIPERMTVYGEIVGYLEGTQTMIQKDYDYGCDEGEWKFMPYRITETDEYGNKKEWNLKEVDAWTEKLVQEHPELAKKVLRLTILYYGKMGDLYPDIDVSQHWRENVLERLKTEKKFLMEELEPLCKHKVPREGIVLRIIDDKFPEAWKLKCKAFWDRETKQHDKGEVDMEETA